MLYVNIKVLRVCYSIDEHERAVKMITLKTNKAVLTYELSMSDSFEEFEPPR